jgi:hypothetical protein
MPIENQRVHFIILKRLSELQLKPSELQDLTGVTANVISDICHGRGTTAWHDLAVIASCLQISTEVLAQSVVDEHAEPQQFQKDAWTFRKLLVQRKRAINTLRALRLSVRESIQQRRGLLEQRRKLLEEARSYLCSSDSVLPIVDSSKSA